MPQHHLGIFWNLRLNHNKGSYKLTAKMLNQKDLAEFKKIWLDEFGEVIDDNMAEEQGQRLLNLFKEIYRPMPVEDVEGEE